MEYIILGVALIFLIFIFSAFRPAKTQKITENLYSIRCGIVNFYAFKTENGVILFDTGVNAALAKRGLEKLGMSAESVTDIFLTHTDYDHAGGIAAFPKATVYISKEEEQMINGQTPRRGLIHNSRLPSYRTLENGETLMIDNISVQVFVKPGHTPGSAAYMIDQHYLATGDLLRVSAKGSMKPFLWLMNKNHKQDIQSLKEAQSIINDAEYILTGHTGFYRFK